MKKKFIFVKINPFLVENKNNMKLDILFRCEMVEKTIQRKNTEKSNSDEKCT